MLNLVRALARTSWRSALGAASYLLTPLSGVLWLLQLVRHADRIRRAEIVLMPVQAKNFGHIVLAADIARRLFRGRRCLYIVVWEPTGTQNPYVTDIFPDIDLLFLRRQSLFLRLGNRAVRVPDHGHHDPMAFAVTRWLARRLAPRSQLLTLENLYARLPIPADLAPYVPSDYLEDPEWVFPAMALWARLVLSVPAARLQLPERTRRNIAAQLHTLAPSARRHCLMFHRLDEKGDGHHRNGSPLDAYIPALRLLTRAGYQVLVAGDRRVSTAIRREFGGKVVDSDMLDVPRAVYRLYAATDVDIFVGDAGGGMYIPMLNGIPQLVLNVYPYAVTAVRSWNVLKTITHADGSAIPLTDLLSAHVYFDQPAGVQIHENSAEEIEQAVAQFLHDLDEPAPQDPGCDLVRLMAPETMFRAGEAQLSPAFVARHGGVAAKAKDRRVGAWR